MATFKDPALCDCSAYREYKRTKGLSAFSWKEPVSSTRTLNQYVTRTTFTDNSFVDVSSCKNRVNLNYMTCYTLHGEGIAIRSLFYRYGDND